MKRKRILVMSDGHAGHRAGLTPPKWWGNLTYDKWADLRSELWTKWAAKIDSLKPIDFLFYVGDAVDGAGTSSGGSELITPDLHDQVEMAVETVRYVDADQIVMVYGTPYHTGIITDFERDIAKEVKAVSISSQEWPQINGVTFDLKHKIANTSIPHGKGAALSKEWLWNLVHKECDNAQPNVDIFIRGHVHYFFHVEDVNWQGFILPGMQGLGSKYGSRQVSGIVHFGFIWFDIEDRETWIESPNYHKWILKGKIQQKQPLIL